VTSVLGKLICRELGREKYRVYFESLEDRDTTEVFCDIYLELREKDDEMLNQMLVRLLETVHASVRINRRFFFILGIYILTMAMIFFLIPMNVIMFMSMIMATCCLIYKVIEFLSNRYCDKDIRMVLIYKSVLFHLMQDGL
jgi:hypothetical protein